MGSRKFKVKTRKEKQTNKQTTVLIRLKILGKIKPQFKNPGEKTHRKNRHCGPLQRVLLIQNQALRGTVDPRLSESQTLNEH